MARACRHPPPPTPHPPPPPHPLPPSLVPTSASTQPAPDAARAPTPRSPPPHAPPPAPSPSARPQDASLRHTLQFGIGLHHAGLPDSDRQLVEKLYVEGGIQVGWMCVFIVRWGGVGRERVSTRADLPLARAATSPVGSWPPLIQNPPCARPRDATHTHKPPAAHAHVCTPGAGGDVDAGMGGEHPSAPGHHQGHRVLRRAHQVSGWGGTGTRRGLAR